MKYLPIRELEAVTGALNFNTSDCRVVGGCDLYTTKAAGGDKKLYKSIDQSLQSQHESLIRLSESLSPPNAEFFNMNLSRDSPFGSLDKGSSRRTFAYLIATLNATHQDYDFSYYVRPSDFRRERSLKSLMQQVNETLFNVQPRTVRPLLALPADSTYQAGLPQTPGGSMPWSSRMWKIIDKEMNLERCEIYQFSPEEDAFDEEESALWSMHLLFFNKQRRRVLYIYFRGLSASSQNPPQPETPTSLKRASPSFGNLGSSKRARFWLGEVADRRVSETLWGEEEDDSTDYVIAEPDEDDDYTDPRVRYSSSYESSDGEDEEDGEDDDEIEQRLRARGSPVRGVSESIAESMEV